MELENVIIEDRRMTVGPISLHADRQEVIGLAGMEGSGQQLLLRACAGLIRPVHGHIRLAGEDILGRSYHGFLKRGVAFMPAARLEEGLIPGLDLTEHFVLTERQQGVMIQRQAAQSRTETQIESFRIKGTPRSPVEALSGGNQQRMLLALLREDLRCSCSSIRRAGCDMESVSGSGTSSRSAAGKGPPSSLSRPTWMKCCTKRSDSRLLWRTSRSLPAD
jgi:simple sugar transport system ATP-binding protein